MKCLLTNQGVPSGTCSTITEYGEMKKACEVTLRKVNGQYERLIKSIHLSRPEDYLSVYQSGCNHHCLKCHSSEFSKHVNGKWIKNKELANIAKDYCNSVKIEEPRSRATMWHAKELCLHCGSCLIYGKPSEFCPQKITPSQIILSPQGLEPARNIIAFTGGDLTCNPEYYREASLRIKEVTNEKLWVLIETNGYALTRKNLIVLQEGGVDSFWLDIKAYNRKVYQKLCGTSNSTVLSCLSHMISLNFVVEVLVLYIPEIVETNQHRQIARLVSDIDPSLPTTLLAFFPSYQLTDHRSPTFEEMLAKYQAMKDQGLENIRLGNISLFAKTEDQIRKLYSLNIC